MSFLSKEQRYEMLKDIKYGSNSNLPKGPLTAEEEQFIFDYASEKLRKVLSDPEVMAAFKKIWLS